MLLGAIPQGSSLQGLATVPEIVWEAFLGLRGFELIGYRTTTRLAGHRDYRQRRAPRYRPR